MFMSTKPNEHDHLKDASWASFQVGLGMFFPQAAWIIPVVNFLRGEKRRKPMQDWQTAIHNALQELDDRVAAFETDVRHQRKTEGLSHLIAVFLVESLSDSLDGRISRDNLLENFKDVSASEVDEAIMELQEDGYARISQAIGHLYIGAQPSPE